VQVVQEQEHRPLPGQPLQQARDRVEQPGLLQGGVAQPLGRGQARVDEQAAEVRQPAEQARPLGRVEAAQQRPESLEQGGVGEPALQRVGPTLQRQEAARPRQRERLPGQAGLADAGLADQEERAATPAGGPGQGGDQPGELGGAADEGRARRRGRAGARSRVPGGAVVPASVHPRQPLRRPGAARAGRVARRRPRSGILRRPVDAVACSFCSMDRSDDEAEPRLPGWSRPVVRPHTGARPDGAPPVTPLLPSEP
jgi:hypothetical protein